MSFVGLIGCRSSSRPPSRWLVGGTREGGPRLCALKCCKSLIVAVWVLAARVTAGDAGLELLPGCLVVAGPGVTGGAPAGPGFDFVAGGVPEVYLENFGVQHDVLGAGLPVT